MSGGMVALGIITLLVLMGVGHRVLDRLRLSDKAALAILIAIVLSTIFIPDIEITNNVSVNVGGFIIPMGLCIYLFIKAETTKEKTRSIIGALVAGIGIYAVQKIMPAEPENIPIDPNYIYALVGAVIAYLLGRSRRGAFIAGVVGVVISDLIQLIINSVNNMPAPTRFGGAGGVDTTVFAGILALILAEVFGEAREKMQGGTDKKHMYFDKGHFVSKFKENRVKDKEIDEMERINIYETRGDIDEEI